MSPLGPDSTRQTGRASGRPRGRTGRRPGEPPTRAVILAAARVAFSVGGYDHATIRDIAARAHVDPALVLHYFGSKEQLFAAALELPLRPAELVGEALAVHREHAGEFAVRRFLTVWEDPHNKPIMMALLRSVVSNEYAADLVRRLLGKMVLEPLATQLELPDAALRANLLGTQFIGLALARYVARIEPLASADVETLVAAVGPTIQRYLTGDLGAEAPPKPRSSTG